jgi:hypothetical protein
MVIGGSTLIGTAMANSDLDILFLVPKLKKNLFEDILESFYQHLKEAIKNEAELNKFVCISWSFSFNLINENTGINAARHTASMD